MTQFRNYRSESVLEVAISLLQEQVYTGSRDFFTTVASLYWKSQFLYCRSESVLEVAISLPAVRDFGRRAPSQFRLARFRCR